MGASRYWSRPHAMDAPNVATTQTEVNAFSEANVPFVITGGTVEDPLYLKLLLSTPPAVGSGAHVVVLPANLSKPAAVYVMGKGATVLGLRNARIVCNGESTITGRDRAKVVMYKGVLKAFDHVRATLFSESVGYFYGKSKGFVKNEAEAFCYEESFIYVCHQSHVHVKEETAHIWIRDFNGCLIDPAPITRPYL